MSHSNATLEPSPDLIVTEAGMLKRRDNGYALELPDGQILTLSKEAGDTVVAMLLASTRETVEAMLDSVERRQQAFEHAMRVAEHAGSVYETDDDCHGQVLAMAERQLSWLMGCETVDEIYPIKAPDASNDVQAAA